MAKKKGPVIRHANSSKESRVVRRIVRNFVEHMETTARYMVANGKINKDILGIDDSEISGEQLLKNRKKLAAIIKNGMLERKDMEAEIAIMAAIVWFLRQEKSKRDRITEEWG